MHRNPVIIIDALPYSPETGGFETALFDLLDSCESMADEFSFVVLCNRQYRKHFKHKHLNFVGYRYPRALRIIIGFVIIPLAVLQYKAVAVHSEIYAAPLIWIPHSVTVHDLFYLIKPGLESAESIKGVIMSLYWRKLFIYSLKRCTLIKVISQSTKKDVSSYIGNQCESILIYPKVDLPLFPLRINVPRSADCLDLLFIGSVVPRKNLRFLMDALPFVKRRVHLHVVGNIWWDDTVRTESQRVDKNMTFYGYVPHSKKIEVLERAHVLILPSLYEGFGYPIVEAIANNRLALGARNSSMIELLPEECLFDLDSPMQLAAMIDSITEDNYEGFLQKALTLVRQFSAGAHVSGHRAMFRELICRARQC